MNTRELLLTAIRRNRADDLPRLVFADYLQENGLEPEREEFIRVQVEAARLESEKVTLLNDDTDWLRCTELSAAWCPNCGDCVCKNREESMSDDGCPLHAADSPHGCADELNRKLDDLRRRETELWQRNCLDWFPFAEVNNDLRMWDRGFVRVMETNWNFWSANAATILPEHPGLERVVLTTPPVIDYTVTQSDNRPDRETLLVLTARAAGMVADVRRFVSHRELVMTPNLNVLAMTVDRMRNEMTPELLLKKWWGGDPEEGGWGVTFDLPRPDAHGGQYRHWDQEITRAIMGPEYLADQIAREEVAAVERILRDLLAEHGITEDDLRAGRREVTRVTNTGGRPPNRVQCNCNLPERRLVFHPEDAMMPTTYDVIELRERLWELPGGTRDNLTRVRYLLADGICPRCNRLYFAVTRVER